MENGKIGVQMMMLKQKVLEEGMYNVLGKVASLGFHAVEISQLAMTPDVISQMKQAQKDFGIEIVALSAALHSGPVQDKSMPFDSLEDQFDKIVADCKSIGCSILRIGMTPLDYLQSPEKILDVTDQMEVCAKRLRDYDISLYLHAHHMEYHRWNGKPMMTHMLERTEALNFEMDTHWLYRGGMTPTYMENFRGRMYIFHLKDYRIGLLPEIHSMEQLARAFGDIEQTAEIGEGVLDIPAFIQAAQKSGCKYFMIEQDFLYGRDAYESLALSRDNLIKMGYGDWF